MVSIAVFLHGGAAGVEHRQVVRKVGPWTSSSPEHPGLTYNAGA